MPTEIKRSLVDIKTESWGVEGPYESTTWVILIPYCRNASNGGYELKIVPLSRFSSWNYRGR